MSETFHIPGVLPESCYHCQQALPGFRPDRFGIHFVSLKTKQVVSRAEMERIAGIAKTEEPPKKSVVRRLKEFASEL